MGREHRQEVRARRLPMMCSRVLGDSDVVPARLESTVKWMMDRSTDATKINSQNLPLETLSHCRKVSKPPRECPRAFASTSESESGCNHQHCPECLYSNLNLLPEPARKGGSRV
eukprot:453460-Rhodomonas_salina.2